MWHYGLGSIRLSIYVFTVSKQIPLPIKQVKNFYRFKLAILWILLAVLKVLIRPLSEPLRSQFR